MMTAKRYARQHPTKDIQIRSYVRYPSRVPADLASNPRVHITVGEGLDREASRSSIWSRDVVLCGYLGRSSDFPVVRQTVLIDA